MPRARSPRAATQKNAAKKTSAKTSAKKTSATTSAKPSAKKTGAERVRNYSPKASEDVRDEMRELKSGTLRSGSGAKVTDPKQAIAIGLSKARRSGAKVPKPPKTT